MPPLGISSNILAFATFCLAFSAFIAILLFFLTSSDVFSAKRFVCVQLLVVVFTLGLFVATLLHADFPPTEHIFKYQKKLSSVETLHDVPCDFSGLLQMGLEPNASKQTDSAIILLPTRTEPSFFISLFHPESDPYTSRRILHDLPYRREKRTAIHSVLSSPAFGLAKTPQPKGPPVLEDSIPAPHNATDRNSLTPQEGTSAQGTERNGENERPCVVVDTGAGLGYWTLYAAAHNRCRVLSFEPSEAPRAKLLQSLRANEGSFQHHVAVLPFAPFEVPSDRAAPLKWFPKNASKDSAPSLRSSASPDTKKSKSTPSIEFLSDPSLPGVSYLSHELWNALYPPTDFPPPSQSLNRSSDNPPSNTTHSNIPSSPNTTTTLLSTNTTLTPHTHNHTSFTRTPIPSHTFTTPCLPLSHLIDTPIALLLLDVLGFEPEFFEDLHENILREHEVRVILWDFFPLALKARGYDPLAFLRQLLHAGWEISDAWDLGTPLSWRTVKHVVESKADKNVFWALTRSADINAMPP